MGAASSASICSQKIDHLPLSTEAALVPAGLKSFDLLSEDRREGLPLGCGEEGGASRASICSQKIDTLL